MITISVGIKDQITGQLKSIQKQLRQVPDEAHKEFVALTPVRTGNARRRTSRSGDVIVANYAYAQRLDEGWSKQAPRGMTEPWEKWLQRRLKQIFGK